MIFAIFSPGLRFQAFDSHLVWTLNNQVTISSIRSLAVMSPSRSHRTPVTYVTLVGLPAVKVVKVASSKQKIESPKTLL